MKLVSSVTIVADMDKKKRNMAQAGYVEQIKQICKDPARRKQLAQIHLNLPVRT